MGQRTKRAQGESLDASLDALTTKLGAALTCDREALVASLCEVLGTEPSVAAFYLEACNNDAHAAVHMHMMQGQAEPPSKRSRPPPRAEGYVAAPLHVNGLPEGWSARVSAAGTVIFVHDKTGHEQAVVPPGFAPQAATAMWTDLPSNQATVEPPPASEFDVTDHTREHSHRHPNVVCDACEQQICGVRYNCLTRHNFDLCEACMWSEAHAPLRVGRWMKMSIIAA